MLEDGQVPVHIYNPPRRYEKEFLPIMHDKFAVFDDELVWSGSYNWTVSANVRNQENALLIEGEPEVVSRFAQQFEILKERCAAYIHKGIPMHPDESVGTVFTAFWESVKGLLTRRS